MHICVTRAQWVKHVFMETNSKRRVDPHYQCFKQWCWTGRWMEVWVSEIPWWYVNQPLTNLATLLLIGCLPARAASPLMPGVCKGEWFSWIILRCVKDIHSPKILDEFDYGGSALLNMCIIDHLMSWPLLAFLDSFFKLNSPNLVQR